MQLHALLGLAMHAAASNPSCITQDDIDKDILEREKAIYKKQAEESGKDEKIMEKMVEGKVRRFLEEVSFVSQPFVKNPDQKIQELLDERGAACCSSLIKEFLNFLIRIFHKWLGYKRYLLKKSSDFTFNHLFHDFLIFT